LVKVAAASNGAGTSNAVTSASAAEVAARKALLREIFALLKNGQLGAQDGDQNNQGVDPASNIPEVGIEDYANLAAQQTENVILAQLDGVQFNEPDVQFNEPDVQFNEPDGQFNELDGQFNDLYNQLALSGVEEQLAELQLQEDYAEETQEALDEAYLSNLAASEDALASAQEIADFDMSNEDALWTEDLQTNVWSAEDAAAQDAIF
jgi:hypothetical protein